MAVGTSFIHRRAKAIRIDFVGAFILLGLVLWFVMTIAIGRVVRWASGSGVLSLLVMPVVFLLPFVDVLAGVAVARRQLQQSLFAVQPSSPIRAAGFMLVRGRAIDAFDAEPYLKQSPPFEFIEAEYPQGAPWANAIPELGAGYYQFRLPLSEDACSRPKDGTPSDHFLINKLCIRITVTEYPVSRYAYRFSIEHRPSLLPSWRYLRIICSRVVDLRSRDDVARRCQIGVGSWLLGEQLVLVPTGGERLLSPSEIIVPAAAQK